VKQGLKPTPDRTWSRKQRVVVRGDTIRAVFSCYICTVLLFVVCSGVQSAILYGHHPRHLAGLSSSTLTTCPNQDLVITEQPSDPSKPCTCTTYRTLPASRQSSSVPMQKGGVLLAQARGPGLETGSSRRDPHVLPLLSYPPPCVRLPVPLLPVPLQLAWQG